MYPPLPFYIDSYKFTKVKIAPEFVKELEYFHFGEKKIHGNDSKDNIENYCSSVGVHFEYTNYWDKDEKIFHNACNMTTFSRRFKKKIKTVGGKGGSSSTAEQQKKEEEAGKKEKKNPTDCLRKQRSSYQRRHNGKDRNKKTIAEKNKKSRNCGRRLKQ